MAQKELIIMTQKELPRYETIKRLIKGEINGTEAAKQISLSTRQVRRLKFRVKKYGIKGVIHGNRGKTSNRRMSKEQIAKIKIIVKEKYVDFGPTFAVEKLEESHQIKVGKEKLRQLMIEWDFWKSKPRKKNKEYRSWRPRKEYYGEMIQFDGSYHHWFETRAPACCLLGAIDDASGKITGLRFVPDEGVAPVFTFWRQYVQTQGKPVSIYLDRHSTYHQNQPSVFDDPDSLTQFQRAMKDLDLQIIHAHSPQAKGRAERLFNTLQDRLVKELRLADVSTVERANQFVEEVFIPQFNQKFAVLAQKKGDLHKPLTIFEKKNLERIFSRQDLRVVNNDFTIRFKNQWWQLSESQPTLVLRKEKILIEERINGQIFISLKNKYLNYTTLPERPKKVKMPIIALAKTKPAWKPPANHPWRRQFWAERMRVRQQTFVN